MPEPETFLFELMERTPNQLGLAVLMLLAWLSTADGPVSSSERDRLWATARANDNEADCDHIIRIAAESRVEDLLLAAEVAGRCLNVRQRELFIELAIGASLCDGYLSIAANYILRLFSDLVGCTPVEFNRLFRGYAGCDLPAPGDPSSPSWWRWKENGSARREGPHAASEAPMGNRERAYAVLGVQKDASILEIKTAFRRLVKKHHPDRFAQLGPVAVEEASRQFARINDAYETLLP